nr:MAG TPA: hypothetical protein [Caudoviricetes sp.]
MRTEVIFSLISRNRFFTFFTQFRIFYIICFSKSCKTGIFSPSLTPQTLKYFLL